MDIGPHYAVTLRSWRAAWERERAAILRLGYSDHYWRKFRYHCSFFCFSLSELPSTACMLACGGLSCYPDK